MFWIKLGILITGFIYAGILPYTIYKSMKTLGFNPREFTLSHMGIEEWYGKRYRKGYTMLMFLAAVLNYFFFWLLTVMYDLGEYEIMIEYINFSSIYLILLAFIPFNLIPYQKGNLRHNLKRTFHNIFAVLVFISLGALIILFNVALYEKYKLLSILGFISIGLTAVQIIWSVIRNSITGLSELLFINGLCAWSILVTIFTILR